MLQLELPPLPRPTPHPRPALPVQVKYMVEQCHTLANDDISEIDVNHPALKLFQQITGNDAVDM